MCLLWSTAVSRFPSLVHSSVSALTPELTAITCGLVQGASLRHTAMRYHLCMVAEHGSCCRRKIAERRVFFCRMGSNSGSDVKLVILVISWKSADLTMVDSIIGETMTLFKAEWGEDDKKGTLHREFFGQTKCKAKILTHQLSGHRDVIAKCKVQLSNPDVRIERIPEDIIDVDVPRVMEKVVEVVKHIPMMEGNMEGVKPIPHDEVQKRTVKKIVAVPVLHGFGKKLGK